MAFRSDGKPVRLSVDRHDRRGAGRLCALHHHGGTEPSTWRGRAARRTDPAGRARVGAPQAGHHVDVGKRSEVRARARCADRAPTLSLGPGRRHTGAARAPDGARSPRLEILVDRPHLPRREFVRRSATALGAMSAAVASVPAGAQVLIDGVTPAEHASSGATAAPYNGVYEGARLNRVAFPMGGIGAGMLCLEGTGALSHVSIRNEPDVFNAPCAFAALAIKGATPVARVLEGPVPGWKLFGMRDSANGDEGTSYGLPRFQRASFTTRFPFASVALADDGIPLDVADHRLESVCPRRRGQLESPGRRAGVRIPQSERRLDRRGLLVQRQEFPPTGGWRPARRTSGTGRLYALVGWKARRAVEGGRVLGVDARSRERW